MASISVYIRPAVSEEPSTTEPQPSTPAATAPCIASGAAAKVMRAACTLGTRPCSAIATSVALSTAASPAEGSRPTSRRKKCSMNETLPISSFERSRPRTTIVCSSEVQIAVRGTVALPIFMAGS